MKHYLILFLLLLSSFNSLGAIEDYNLVLSSGQSLSIGHTDQNLNPIIFPNAVNPEKVFLFNGVRTSAPQYNQKLVANDVSFLEPLKDITRQTHAYSMFNMLEYLYEVEKKPFPKFIYAPHARGGQKISNLEYGTEPFENGLTMLRAGEKLAAQNNENFNVPFITWIHGESNANSNLQEYKQKLGKLYNAYKNKIQATSSITRSPILFIDQTGVSYGHEMAVALWQFVKDNDSFSLVMPKYFLNRNYFNKADDRTHLNAKGYILQGEYFAKAIFSSFVLNKKWKPLQPESLKIDGNKAFLTLHVPEGNLTIDTQTLPEAPGFGLKYISPDNIEFIPQVTVQGNSLMLEFNTLIEVGGKIDSGFTLDDRYNTANQKTPVTNIRDTSELISSIDQLRLHNWLVQFSIEITPQTLGMSSSVNPSGNSIWNDGDIVSNMSAPFTIIGGSYNDESLDYALYRVSFDVEIESGYPILNIGDSTIPITKKGKNSFVAIVCEPTQDMVSIVSTQTMFTGSMHSISLKPILSETNFDQYRVEDLGENIWPNNVTIDNFEMDELSVTGDYFIKTKLQYPIYLLEYEIEIGEGTAYINIGDFHKSINDTGVFYSRVPICIPEFGRLRFSAGKFGFSGKVSNIEIEPI
ncbi:sialate O-acetylesterase [Pseudoalteromonas ostreae]|uniref:sialate O-acetylesterase n=1 Tax=Pseudoalteromonas ostreae TaxID=2774154 RepID=UPI001B35B57D|nr:sialate O-acetylesterase [Pseudoalteromonas ostreae]